MVLNEKKLILWGAGKFCKDFLEEWKGLDVAFVLDNSKEKEGSLFCGIPVLHPSKIQRWDLYKIVITLSYSYAKAVAGQLKEYGLREGSDFEIWRHEPIVPNDISLENVKNVMAEIAFTNEEDKECEILFHTRKEYEDIVKNRKAMVFERYLDKIYSRLPNRSGLYKGFCECCKKEMYFTLDYRYAGTYPAWRERAVCPECGCNSRMRYIADRTLRSISQIKDGLPDGVYIYERITNLYRVLSKYIPGLIGSEYLGEDKNGGRIYDGIRHEDALQLSFESDSMDMMISTDVFEHVADYRKAFSEAYRVLRKGGRLLFTVPFFADRDKTASRAEIDCNGETVYLKPPIYHGNPLSSGGSLVFHEFGWDLLELLKENGFSEVHYIAYFSVSKAYFGDFGQVPLAIEAMK